MTTRKLENDGRSFKSSNYAFRALIFSCRQFSCPSENIEKEKRFSFENKSFAITRQNFIFCHFVFQ